MVVAGSTAANEKFSMGRSVSILVVRLAGRTYWMGCLTAILQYTIVMALSRILTQKCKRRLTIFDYYKLSPPKIGMLVCKYLHLQAD